VSSLFAIVVVCGIVWALWSEAVLQLRDRQMRYADNADFVEHLRAEERAYNKEARFAITGAIIGLFFGIAGFGGPISGVILGVILGWTLSLLSVKTAR
jgi:hypothetical protein